MQCSASASAAAWVVTSPRPDVRRTCSAVARETGEAVSHPEESRASASGELWIVTFPCTHYRKKSKSGSASSAAATPLLFQRGLLTPSCASARQSISCSADGCPAASGCSAVTAAADPLTPAALVPSQPVLPNVGEETPLGRSRFLCPVLQNERGNTEGCLLSNSPKEKRLEVDESVYSDREADGEMECIY
ncbi:hypothetical protein U0070_026546 [Myodes glareolus]|uniref:Uncharacterized protein n=1 Tax=Myodes glareolus TaxID=447135 RepID=A0AAW0I7H4_MYOGA